MLFEQAELTREIRSDSKERKFLAKLYKYNMYLQDMRDVIYQWKTSEASEYLFINEMEALLSKAFVNYEKKRATLLEFLEAIPCFSTYKILKLRYVEFKKFSQISKETNYCMQSVFNYHRKGLDWVKKELEKKEELCL